MAQSSCLAPPNLDDRNRQGNPSHRRPPRQGVLGIRWREVGAHLWIRTNNGGGISGACPGKVNALCALYAHRARQSADLGPHLRQTQRC